MSLQDAAKTLNMSKKSLDDYLLQIRFGNKFGFDFDKHAKDKVGKLRNFVRDEKENLKSETGLVKISSKNNSEGLKCSTNSRLCDELFNKNLI